MIEGKALSKKGIKKLLALLPELEAKKTPYAEYKTSTEHIFPDINWSEELSRLYSAIYEAGLVQPFDWGDWQDEAKRIYNSPELLQNSNIDTIQNLLTLHVRKDRFCDGHLASMCASGHIMAILRRLRELWIAGLVEAE